MDVPIVVGHRCTLFPMSLWEVVGMGKAGIFRQLGWAVIFPASKENYISRKTF